MILITDKVFADDTSIRFLNRLDMLPTLLELLHIHGDIPAEIGCEYL
nr:hypothetical protein [uncultured Acinetobacter sp.]